MSEIKQTALRLLELRSKATQGEWRVLSYGNGLSYLEHDLFDIIEDDALEIEDSTFIAESANHIESIIKWALEMEEMVKNQTKSMQELVDKNDKLRYQRDKWVYECTISERMNSSMYDKRVKELDQELESVGSDFNYAKIHN
jgi:hypothetical protein